MSHGRLSSAPRRADQVEVAIEGVGSKCLFAAVELWAILFVPGGLVGSAPARVEIYSVAWRTDHLFGSDEREALEAVLRRSYSSPLGCDKDAKAGAFE